MPPPLEQAHVFQSLLLSLESVSSEPELFRQGWRWTESLCNGIVNGMSSGLVLALALTLARVGQRTWLHRLTLIWSAAWLIAVSIFLSQVEHSAVSADSIALAAINIATQGLLALVIVMAYGWIGGTSAHQVGANTRRRFGLLQLLLTIGFFGACLAIIKSGNSEFSLPHVETAAVQEMIYWWMMDVLTVAVYLPLGLAWSTTARRWVPRLICSLCIATLTGIHAKLFYWQYDLSPAAIDTALLFSIGMNTTSSSILCSTIGLISRQRGVVTNCDPHADDCTAAAR